jgi:hypothetical protein
VTAVVLLVEIGNEYHAMRNFAKRKMRKILDEIPTPGGQIKNDFP